MQRYAKIVDNINMICDVGLGSDDAYYKSLDMHLTDVEQSSTGIWYAAGYSPKLTYAEKRAAEYPAIGEQLDMLYWDKINNTNNWQEKITEIKIKYPKEVSNEETPSVCDSVLSI